MHATQPNPYRTLHFLVAHGDKGVVVVTILVLLAGVLGAVLTGALWAIPVVLAADALLYVLARSYVEMVQVIVDMLLPK
jgi:hypothetical protein